MTHKKIFLGWNHTFSIAIQNLCLDYASEQKHIKVVLPNIDAVTELNRHIEIIDKVEIITLNQFTSSFFKNKIANTTHRIFAWQKVFSETDTIELQEIFPAEFKFGNTNLFNLAKIANKFTETIFNCDLDLSSVATICEQKKIDNAIFWSKLSELTDKYIQALKSIGYIDINHQLLSIKEFNLNDDVVIIAGCQNLSQLEQRIIKSIPNLIIAINAPEIHSDGYNHYGTLEPEYWENISIDLSDDDIIFCESTYDEIEIAAELCKKGTSAYILEDNTHKLFQAKLEESKLSYNNHTQHKLSLNNLIKLIIKIIDYASSNTATYW